MARILQLIDLSREPASLFLTSIAEALPLAIALVAADAVLTCAGAARQPSTEKLWTSSPARRE